MSEPKPTPLEQIVDGMATAFKAERERLAERFAELESRIDVELAAREREHRRQIAELERTIAGLEERLANFTKPRKAA